MNLTTDESICIDLQDVPIVNAFPEDVTVKTEEDKEDTERVRDGGTEWCGGREDHRDRKNNSINYILQTRLSIAEDNHPTTTMMRSWTGTRNWVAGSKDRIGSMVWTGPRDCTTRFREGDGLREWTASDNWTGSVDNHHHQQRGSKDWTTSTDDVQSSPVKKKKGNSFIDLLQTVPTSDDDDDEEVQGLLCLSRHPKVADLMTSDYFEHRFKGQLQTTEAEHVSREISAEALRDLANDDNSRRRQMATHRPELDFRKMQRKSFIRKSKRKRHIAPFQATNKSTDIERVNPIIDDASAFTFKSLSLRLTYQNRMSEI